MINVLKEWYDRHFSDPQVVILAFMLMTTAGLIFALGDILAPVLVALILAYLLDVLVTALIKIGVGRTLAVTTVMLLFLILFWMAVVGLMPVLSRQVAQLVTEMPNMIIRGQVLLQELPELYPAFVSVDQVHAFSTFMRKIVGSWGEAILSYSLENVMTFFTLLVYAILIPLLVFFALKDKYQLMTWVSRFMPDRRQLITKVWHQVDAGIANYIRGKIIEIMIVWIVTYITFALMGLNFSLLLSFLVGISVIIPFVGAITVTIPVALIAFFQWGFSAEFAYLLLAYQVIQLLDGNVLVPLLFSEVVNIHPFAIVVAVLFFGGLWGVWGVFFAIPLATVIQAVLSIWPDIKQKSESEEIASTS